MSRQPLVFTTTEAYEAWKAERREQGLARKAKLDALYAERMERKREGASMTQRLKVSLYYSWPTCDRNGLTVAFKVRGEMIELAVASCHPHDEFNCIDGRYFATLAFGDSRTIKVPREGMLRAHDQIALMFDPF
jgi:hypothetical protein